MKLNNAYMISYLPDDERLRLKRKTYHFKQNTWLNSLGFRSTVVCRNYKKEDYIDGVNYIQYTDTTLVTNVARNPALKEFYASDDDFCLLLDDDAILYDHADGSNLIEIVRSLSPEAMKDIDLFFPINPIVSPFTAWMQENKDVIDKSLYFKSSRQCKASFLVLKNLRKYYGKEYYFNTEFKANKDGKLIWGGDIEFALQLIKDGLGVYECKNAVLKEMGSAASTWNDKENKTRDEMKVVSVDLLSRLHNIDKTDNGWLDLTSWMKKHFKRPKHILVPKSGEDGGLEARFG